jgi:hypothetical protein
MTQKACPECGKAWSPDCFTCRRASQERAPQPTGVTRPHLLDWGDAYASYLVCRKCGVGWSRNATVLDLLTECPGYQAVNG